MESQCTDCIPGYFCDSEGKSSPTGLCKAGFYCPVGSKRMEEVDCPIGFHCPEGNILTCFNFLMYMLKNVLVQKISMFVYKSDNVVRFVY